MLLNILQCIGWAPTIKNLPAQSIKVLPRAFFTPRMLPFFPLEMKQEGQVLIRENHGKIVGGDENQSCCGRMG